jgi:uncharacterized membrane protein YdjX (TVP38/TMEM64 family)
MGKLLHALFGRSPRKLRWLVVGVLATLTAGVVAWRLGWADPRLLSRTISDHGPTAMVSYVALVIALEMMWFPRLWGLLAGGLLFGPWLGAGLSMIADLTTATLCFTLARGAARSWAEDLLGRRPKLQRLVQHLAERRGAVTVCVLRVLPMHWTGASYAAGVAGVPPRQYAIGTFLGVLPGAVLYNFVGDAARDPTSPMFIGGASVMVLLALLGGALARRLWHQPLADADRQSQQVSRGR